MGFLTFLKKEDSKDSSAIGNDELPPLPDISPKTAKMHADDLGLPPMPEFEEEKDFGLKPLEEHEELPDMIPSLGGHEPIAVSPKKAAPFSPVSAEMDEAPEFPTIDDYLKTEGIEEAIPPLKIKEPLAVERPIIRAEPKKPIFITLGDYKSVLGAINNASMMVQSSVNTLLRLVDVKIPLDVEYGKLNELLEDAERKISYIDKLFFEETFSR